MHIEVKVKQELVVHSGLVAPIAGKFSPYPNDLNCRIESQYPDGFSAI
jgi:hypothetical protein